MYGDGISSDNHANSFVTSFDIDETFNVISKKFTISILGNMIEHNQTRFNEILKSIGGLNNKTLSARLKDMLENGLVDRKIIPGIPLKIEYSVTEKGKDVLPILHQMINFSTKYKTRKKTSYRNHKDELEERSTTIPEPFKLYDL